MAQSFPKPVVPDSFGVNVSGHELNEKDFALMKKANVRWVRRGILWTQIEKEKGVYDFEAADEFIDTLEEHDLGFLCVLAFGNKLYEPDQHWMGVRTAAGREGFADYAAAMARRYKGRRIVFEIWNESNSGFWKPKPDPDQYMDMLEEAVPAMRKAAPNCTIVAPSLIHIGWRKARRWYEGCLERGICRKVDGFSFHAYGDPGRNAEVERNIQWAAEMREMMGRHGAARSYPFIQSEYGINQNAPEFRKHPRDQWERLQAQSVTRNYLVCLMLKVPINIHYEWKSRSESTRGDKGLLNRDKTTTVAYQAFRTLTTVLDGCAFGKRLPGHADDDYVFVFAHASGKTMLAAWTTGEPHAVEISVTGADAVDVWDMTGAKAAVPVESGKVAIELTNGPAYCGLGKGSVAGAATGEGR